MVDSAGICYSRACRLRQVAVKAGIGSGVQWYFYPGK